MQEGKTYNLPNDVRHVVLIGDSTLDNIVWVSKPEQSMPSQLRAALNGVKVTNFAADGFNSEDVRNGAAPSISRSARARAGDPFPAGSEAHFEPLKHIKSVGDVSHVVVSFGGNDVREILRDMSHLQSRIQQFWTNYPAVIEEVLKVTPKVILLQQYRPSYGGGKDGPYHVYAAMASLPGPGSSLSKINTLMETVYPPILELARKHKLPVVDLPSTFDVNDEELYVMQIEPSAKGGALISDMICHVLSHHNFTSPSTIYYKKGNQVDSYENTPDLKWKVKS